MQNSKFKFQLMIYSVMHKWEWSLKMMAW